MREETAGFGRHTQRPARTDSGINFVHPEGGYSRGPKRIKAQPETDEQLYARKLSEASNTKRGRVVGVGRVKSIPTLTEDIRQHGVQTPIALGHQEGLFDPEKEHRFVAGGHHRIAVMAHLNPDQYLPVQHVRSVGEAQSLGL